MKQKQGLPSSVKRVKLFHESIKSTEHSQATSSVLSSLPQICEPREAHVWIDGQLLFPETHSSVDTLWSFGMGPAGPPVLAGAPCSPLTNKLILHVTARRAILLQESQPILQRGCEHYIGTLRAGWRSTLDPPSPYSALALNN